MGYSSSITITAMEDRISLLGSSLKSIVYFLTELAKPKLNSVFLSAINTSI